MSEILFLAHRIPYPPDKGDKIRSYHLLRALLQQHTVHLGAFVDDPADWEHEEVLRKLCGEVCLRPIRRPLAKLRSAGALLCNRPMTLLYYWDSAMWRWTQKLAMSRELLGVFAYSSSMGQYAEALPISDGGRRVIDFCDVDSDKWRQYSESCGFPLKQLFAREARRLSDYEGRCLGSFDATLVISQTEAQILRECRGDTDARIRVVPNGVNTEYFNPSIDFPSPFASKCRAIVFTGAMDYQANIDGVRWFVETIFPEIRAQIPDVSFWIVGSNPTPQVTALESNEGVVVTGRVSDVRPYLRHATVVVAPLRIARGVQNKVLEAIAMERPVVATPNAVQGIPEAEKAGISLATGAEEFSTKVIRFLRMSDDSPTGREFALARYSWEGHMTQVLELFRKAA